jgi:hypothetical protein
MLRTEKFIVSDLTYFTETSTIDQRAMNKRFLTRYSYLLHVTTLTYRVLKAHCQMYFSARRYLQSQNNYLHHSIPLREADVSLLYIPGAASLHLGNVISQSCCAHSFEMA